jgi:hypothetical protein
MTIRSSFVQRYKGLGPLERFGVWASAASILGLLVGILTLHPSSFFGGDDQTIFIQTGTIDAALKAPVSDPEFDVYYPVPYQFPPELTWTNMPYQIRVLEQRADGFRVRFTGSYYGSGSPMWQAKGIPQRHK